MIEIPVRTNGRPLESTADLLEMIRRGDRTARDRLVGRYLPILRRWGHGRLPLQARDLCDTDDLVQMTLIRSLDHVQGFEFRHEGAFLAYLRKILLNHIRDEIRRRRRQPVRVAIDDGIPDGKPSPLEESIGIDTLDRYERALSRLSREYQEAIVLRVEFQLTYEAMAAALNRPTANAARLLVSRALIRLSEEMHERA